VFFPATEGHRDASQGQPENERNDRSVVGRSGPCDADIAGERRDQDGDDKADGGDYDEAEFMLGIGAYLYPLYRNLAPRVSAALQARYGIAEEMSYWDLVALLVANVEEIRSRRWMRLPDRYVSEVVRYRDVILTMLGFYAALRSNDRKDTPYPERRLKALLQVPSAGSSRRYV